MLQIDLPYPPSINHYWRRVGPRTLISREGRRFRQKVVAILAALRVRSLEGSLSVHIDLYPPDHRWRDVDNTLKAMLDALEHGGAYKNDNQIVALSIHRRQVIRGGLATVRIEAIQEGK